MNLLSELIPAIREIRAPLVGGYLWLFAIWLKFGAHVPVSTEISPNTVWDNLHRLSGVAGAFSAVVILSVAAYLLGALVGELLNAIFTWRLDFDEYALDNLAASVPDARYLVELASRAYAEAQLRAHVALPLAAIAFILPGWWAHILTFLAAALLTIHAMVYLGRAKIRHHLATTLAERRQQDATLGDRRANRAEVRARVQRRDDQRVLTITNAGPGIARAINIRTAEGQLPSFIVDGYFPIEELRPGDAVDVLLSITFGIAQSSKVVLSWEDNNGANEDVVTLFLL